MKICDNCGYRNWKIELDDKNKPICSSCGDELPRQGEIRPHGHKLGSASNGEGESVSNDGWIIGPISNDQ